MVALSESCNYYTVLSFSKMSLTLQSIHFEYIYCEGMYSDWAPVISGVPQGSVIAPILFLIYINDLLNNLKSTVRLFADATIIYMTISNYTDATALHNKI